MRPAVPFWDRVKKTDTCWLFQGCKSGGYGTVRFGGKMHKAHRVAWMLTFGDIPEGMYVCHECDNPPCVRPDHLFLGTNQQNAVDRHSKGRTKNLELGPLSKKNITHCPQGHEYTHENTGIRKSGGRDCRECSREESRRYLAKNREAINARKRALRARRRLEKDNA